MTVFVVALATILVIDLGYRMRFDMRASRAFSEGIQGEYILKSGLSLGRALLELPKLEGINEDWLGEPWAIVASAPSLPISGVQGDPRLTIVDEEGKIDLNWILEQQSQNTGATGQNTFSGFNSSPTTNPTAAATEVPLYWKNTLRNLFEDVGFTREQFDPEQFRTPGNVSYPPADQVAVLQDWIDTDTNSYGNASFNGEGVESPQSKTLFYNRPLKNLMELAAVPGMTRERIRLIAPYVRVSPIPSAATQRQININTAPYKVLVAIGFPESQALEIVQQRQNLPYTKEMLDTLVEGDVQLKRFTKVSSTEFSIYCRVVMPNTTKWLHAIVTAQGTQKRKTVVRQLEIS